MEQRVEYHEGLVFRSARISLMRLVSSGLSGLNPLHRSLKLAIGEHSNLNSLALSFDILAILFAPLFL
jgi:hypothetical protein